MRLLSFQKNQTPRVGAEKNGSIVDLTEKMGISCAKTLFASGRISEAETLVASATPDFSMAEVTLDLPIPNPEKIYCIGVNYMNRNAEYQDGSLAPQYPSVFVRPPRSFVPHGQAILLPPESEQLDYEGEIALVIGKAGRRILQKQALEHIGGLTAMNEGTLHDWLRHGKFNVTPGKNWEKSGSIGPWIETNLSPLNLTDMKLETRVNGEVRQSDSTASLAFPFARIIEYLSTFTTLMPGDVIATGTPTGAGARFAPPRWLKAGDVVEVDVEGVGLLRNKVAQEVLVHAM